MLLWMQYLEGVLERVLLGVVWMVYIKVHYKSMVSGALKIVENIADNVQGESAPLNLVKVANGPGPSVAYGGQMRITANLGKSYITTETLAEQFIIHSFGEDVISD
jgi:hypothetical protein